MQLEVKKVSVLPATLAANTMYLKGDAGISDSLEIHISSNDGATAIHVPTKTEISNQIASALANFNNIRVVPTYADRLPLVAENRSMVVMVLDATGDPTVTLGGAAYVLEATGTAQAPAASFYKIYEFESMSENFVLSWNNIQGRPTSSPSAIDAAVLASHSHANKTLLDSLGQDGSGNLTISGTTVGNVVLTEAAW